MRAIIGGTGRLPDILAEAMPDAPRFAPRGVTFGEGRWGAEEFRVERLGALVERLQSDGVDELVFAGSLRRPVLDPALFDDFTVRAMSRLAGGLEGGDDRLLRAVIEVFEEAGFSISAPHALLPDLLPPPGEPTLARPSDVDRCDAARGFEVLAAMGHVDLGQACVVAGGQVLTVEAAPGTDWMLETLTRETPGRPSSDIAQGVLCKRPKNNQDRRIDLPAVGIRTVASAAAASLSGLALEAGGVLVLDPDEVIAAADAAGLFLWIRDA